MSATLKYVRHSVAGFVVWPKNLEALAHRDVGQALRHSRDVGHGEILSAGFVEMEDGKPFCHGRSESLGIDSLPEDTAELRAEWGLALPAPAADPLTPAMRADAAAFAAGTCLDGESLEVGDVS